MTPVQTVSESCVQSPGCPSPGCPITPISDCVVIEVETERITSGGLKLPDKTSDAYLKGIVISVGPGRFPDNYQLVYDARTNIEEAARFPMTVRPGDKVAFLKMAGFELEHNGKKYHVVHEGDILAILS